MNESEIFSQAIKLPATERQNFVATACDGNLQLLNEVEALLQEHFEIGSFISEPAVPASPAALSDPISEGPGTKIGPYKLLEQIGEGGFGVVFMAEQTEPVRRKVALKILKPGMDTRQVIARFEAERQALALMDHPNIARVLDAGAAESGRPYFVMELVKGIPITDYCDQYRLPTRERLKLFVDVCQAVQHAHQKGIIHRDLKPSNVMVTEQDGKPLAKVIDFGIAKAMGQHLTDKTLFTGYAQLLGTPQYMSPEQVALSAVDVDTRSDVYSLGVLLFELLTGSTPFDKETFARAAYDELRRIIREDDPPTPSARLLTLDANTISNISARRQIDPQRLGRQVRGELDWIVMKALEKDRSRRYESASTLARDVERHLNDEPVHACPPSAAYRFRKFVRRNTATLTTVALVAAALLVGIVVSTWQAVRATQAQAKANANETRALDGERRAKEEEKKALIAATAEARQRQRAETSERQAVKNFEAALEAVDRLLANVGATELNDVPRVQPVRRKILQDAIQYYERLLVESGNSAAIRFRMAKTWTNIGKLCTDVGDYDSAERAYEPAISLLKQLVAEEPRRDEYRQALAESLVAAGYFYQWTIPHREKMEAMFREAADIYQQLAQDHPQHANFAWWKATAENEIIRERAAVGGRNEAIAHTRRRIALLEQSQATKPYDRGSAWRQLAELLAPVDPMGAEDALRRAVAEYRTDFRIRSKTGDRIQFAQLLNSAGRNLGSRHADEAKGLFEESEALARALIDDDPTNPHYRMALAWNLRDQANLAVSQMQLPAVKNEPAQLDRLLAEADARFEEAVQIVRQLVADLPSRSPIRQQRDREQLMGFLWDQSAHLRQFGTPPNERHKLGSAAERAAKAERLLRERLNIARELVQAAPENKDYEKLWADCVEGLADFLQESDRYDEALALLSETSVANQKLSTIHRKLAEVLAKQGSSQEAIAALSKRIESYPREVPYSLQRAKLAAGLGRGQEALADFTRVLGVEPNEIEALSGRARLYLQMKQYDLSVTDFSHLLDLRPQRWWDRKIRGVARIYVGQFDEALADLRDALQAKPEDRSILTWLTLEAVADCRNEGFKTGFVALAEEAVRLNGESTRSRLVRAQVLTTVGQLERARSDYEFVIQSDAQPDDAPTYNDLAWRLATCSDPKLRDATWAVGLATKAVELKPQHANSLNTLGVAQYRAGHWPAAIAALSKSEEFDSDKHTSFNAFFLAMAHWQMDRKDEAHTWYVKAVQWMEKNLPQNEELLRFRTEAADLLGIQEKQD